MPAGSVSMNVTLDDAPLIGLFARMREFPEHEAPMWDAMGDAMDNSTRMHFRTGRDPQGNPWQVSKRVLKHGGRTLVLKGYLLGSITHNVLDHGFEWGETRVYAGIQQTGGTIHRQARTQNLYFKFVGKSGELKPQFVSRRQSNFERQVHVGSYDIHIPARPSIGIGRDDIVELEDIEVRHLSQAILGQVGVT